jgi:hypothetical protein
MRLVRRYALRVTSDAGKDLVRRFCPDKGFAIFVVYVDVLADGGFQVCYAAEHAPVEFACW